MSDFREWDYQDVHWGNSWCEAPGCDQPGELIYDSDRRNRGVLLCVADADLLLEHQQALALLPAARRHLLPDPWEGRRRDGGRREPLHLPDAQVWDRSPEKWLAEQGYYGDPVDTSDPDWDIPF